MTVIWLVVWLFSSTPPVHASGDNSWFIALIICAAIDLFGGSKL